MLEFEANLLERPELLVAVPFEQGRSAGKR